MNEKVTYGKYRMDEETSAKNNVCLECGDPILFGRQDRKFCCSTCKNRYNNRRLRSGKISRGRVLQVLDRNYSILMHLLKLGISSLGVSDMRHLGFDFDHVTSYHKTRRMTELWCYDIKMLVYGSMVKSIVQIPCLPVSEDDGNI